MLIPARTDTTYWHNYIFGKGVMIINTVILIGRLTKDPTLKHAGATALCNFTLAVDRGLSREKKTEMEQQGKPTADFINIIAWGKTGELVASYITKGRQLAVQGRIQTSSYEGQDGKRIYRTDVVAEKVEFIGENSNNNNNNFNTKDNSMDYGLGNDAYPLNDEDIPF